MSTSNRLPPAFALAGDTGGSSVGNQGGVKLQQGLQASGRHVLNTPGDTCAAADGEREEGEIGLGSSDCDESMLTTTPMDLCEREENFKYLRVKEENGSRRMFPPSTKSPQEFTALKLNKEECWNAASPLACPQVEASSPAVFGREEARLLLQHLVKQGVEWTTYYEELEEGEISPFDGEFEEGEYDELEEGEFSPSDGELEKGEYEELEEGEFSPFDDELEKGDNNPRWRQPEDEVKTATSFPLCAKREECHFAGENQGENKGGRLSSLRRIDEEAQMKRVKEEPLDWEEEEEAEAEAKRLKAKPSSAMKEIEGKGGHSSLRMEESAKTKRVKEEPIDVASPQATFSNTVLNMPVFHRERKPSQTETSRQSDKQQGYHTQEKRPEVSIDTSASESSPVAEALNIFKALVYHFLYEAKPDRRTSGVQAAFMRAAGVMNDNELSLPGDIIGEIEGIEVGRRFSCRGEVSVTGLHRILMAGINVVVMEDAAGRKSRIANSIVFGLGDDYPDNVIGVGKNDPCIFSGEGKATRKSRMNRKAKGLDREPTHRDQKLTGRNRALVNSFKRKIPIRVIKGLPSGPDNLDNKKYMYDGLYQILDVRYESGKRGNKVYKFVISRLS